jgi:hypothetical protein
LPEENRLHDSHHGCNYSQSNHSANKLLTPAILSEKRAVTVRIILQALQAVFPIFDMAALVKHQHDVYF